MGRVMLGVCFEIAGEVAIVTIDRPEVRNAVDGPTATALADAFRRFDAEAGLRVAVLAGRGGNFCAGADLKAVAEGRGLRGGRRPRAGALVRPPGGGRRRGVRRVLQALGRPLDRWRHHPPAAPDRCRPATGDPSGDAS